MKFSVYLNRYVFVMIIRLIVPALNLSENFLMSGLNKNDQILHSVVSDHGSTLFIQFHLPKS